LLYADRITDSMKRAIDETERRRAKQIAFNEEHGIVPKGVEKRIKDIIDGVYNVAEERKEYKELKEQARVAALDEKTLAKEIKRLEKEMLEAARNLEFEKAAALRDELKALKEHAWVNPL
jgi:excinuclease ABC subunit B